jgi:hypothetical protein
MFLIQQLILWQKYDVDTNMGAKFCLSELNIKVKDISIKCNSL